MPIRGIRGAVVAAKNQPEEILSATRELLDALLAANPTLEPEDVASAIFTVSGDLTAAYPAKAARILGWTNTALMCAQEIPVPGSLPGCIRVLIHWNTDIPQSDVNHIYLGDAAILRPDLKTQAEL
jgi:chorismate mutase